MYRRRRRRYSILCRWSASADRWEMVEVRFTSSPRAEPILRARALSEFPHVPWRLFMTYGFACDLIRTVGSLYPPDGPAVFNIFDRVEVSL